MDSKSMISFFLTTIISLGCAQECIEQLDIAFIIDSSLSIRENNLPGVDNWQLTTDFVANTVNQIQVGRDQIRVSLVHYSTEVYEPGVLTLEAGTDKEEVIRRINTMRFLGGRGTNTSGALAYVTNNIFNGNLGDRIYIRDLGILLTDGLSNIDQAKTASEAVRAKNQGIDLFTIGITKYADKAELQEIASDPLGFYYLHVDTFGQLNGVVDQLLGRICTSRPPPQLPCRRSKIDLGILMDESGSIIDKNPPNSPELYNWQLMKNFVARIIESLNVGPDFARISVTKFSDVSRTEFNLDKYNNAQDMVAAVLDFDYRSGATNISGALRTLGTEIFNQNEGDRSTVQNIGVLITDGESTVDESMVDDEAMRLKEMGVTMYGLGITKQVRYSELETIASSPPEDHIFQTETIQDVNELTSILVWGVCNEVPECTGQDCSSPGASRCINPDTFLWKHEENRLLLGHNHARLQSVGSAEQCQSVCLKDPNCRSIDYIAFASECSISYVTRTQQPMEFAISTDADYYEWICTDGAYQPFYSTTSKTDQTDGGTGPGYRPPGGDADINDPSAATTQYISWVALLAALTTAWLSI